MNRGAGQKCENLLGALVDETELAKEANEAAVLELAHKLIFKAIDTTVIEYP